MQQEFSKVNDRHTIADTKTSCKKKDEFLEKSLNLGI